MGARVLSEFSASPTFIDGLLQLRLKRIEDERGIICEFFRDSDYTTAGLPEIDHWPQANVVTNRRGTLRGIHGEKMFKYISVVSGSIKTVHVDLRPGSPTAGQCYVAVLGEGRGMFIPPGVGNGFQAMLDSTYLYRFSEEWSADMPGVGVNPLDPELGVNWPVRGRNMILSDKDRQLPDLFTALIRAKDVFA